MMGQYAEFPRYMWSHILCLFLYALVNVACAVDRKPFHCFLDVHYNAGGRIQTVKETSLKPIELLVNENNVKLICRHSSRQRCQFSWNDRNLTTPVLSNFSISDATVVACHVSCGNSRCNISAQFDIMKPAVLTMSKLRRGASLKTLRNVVTSTENIYEKAAEGYQMTSSNLPETTGYSDANLIVLLCLFGLIIIILSCLAGNASHIADKCRSTSPTLQGRRDESLSRERNPVSQMQSSPAQQNNVNPFTTTRSCVGPNNVSPNFEKIRSQSCYDKTLFAVSTSRRQNVPLPPAPTFNLQRMTSLSDGCICDRTANVFPPFLVENMQSENYENRELLNKTQTSCQGDFLYNKPHGIASTSNSDDICNDVATYRPRLRSEFSYERDLFLSNALKKRPLKNTYKRRLSSQFSYQRDRFLSNAVRNVTIDEHREDVHSPNRRRRTGTGTMTSRFSLTRRYTRSFSGLSLSTSEDVFMNEHIYEAISLDDLRSMGSSDLLNNCKQKLLNSVDDIIEKSFPVYAKCQKISGRQAEGHDNVDSSKKKSKELPPLYITWEEMSQYQRRCSLPSPTEAVDMGFNGDSNYVSHRLATLFASSSFRSEGHISCPSSKINKLDVC